MLGLHSACELPMAAYSWSIAVLSTFYTEKITAEVSESVPGRMGLQHRALAYVSFGIREC